MIASAAPEFLFIYLSKGQFACVDFDAPAEVFNRKWSAAWNPNANKFYAVSKGNCRRTVYMHRIVLGVTDRYIHVDHRNHCGLDNRSSNLRRCTMAQNQLNRRPAKGNRFKGIRKTGKGRWTARIGSRDNVRFLGAFTSEEEAARAYDAAAIELFGEFACLNFPSEAVL